MNNDCNHNKCQCNSDKCGISLKTIPAALGDDTGEFKPENGAYCNTFVKYEANGAQYFYSKDGIFSKVAEIPGYVKQQSDFAETNEESPAFIKNKELVATAEQLEAEATARAEQDEFLHNENVSLGNELNAEKNARIQKDTQLDNAINTKASKAELQTETSARQSAIQAEATARQNADQALSDRMDAFTGMDYVVVDQLPTVGEKGKVYLVPKQGEHPDVHNEFIWVNGQWELIGSTQMDLTDYVKNTDYATDNKGGVFKTEANGIGTYVSGMGYLKVNEKNYSAYQNMDKNGFIGKGTLENVLNGRKYLMPEYTLELPTTGEANKLYLTPATEQPDIEATASGKDIELADASEGDLIDWAIKGDTEQASYTGKNLLRVLESSFNATKNGVTASYNTNDGTITLNGTCTADNTVFYFMPTSESIHLDGKYILSVFYVSGSISNQTNETIVQVQINDYTSSIKNRLQNQNTSVTTTKTNQDFNRNNIRIDNGVVLNNYKIKVQLEQGSTATDFEPYVGGTASPNPEYPQEVKTVTGRQTVSVVGKNLFDGEIEFGQLSISTGEKTTPASDRYRTVNFVPILPNTTYTYSSNLGAERWSCYYDENKVFISSFHMITSTSGKTATFTTPVNARYIKWYTIGGATEYTQQLEIGSVATSFQPYSGQEVELNLGKNLLNAQLLTPVAVEFGLQVDEYGNVSDSSPNSDSRNWGYENNNWNGITLEAGTYTASVNMSVKCTNASGAFRAYTINETPLWTPSNNLQNVDKLSYTFTLTEKTTISVGLKLFNGVGTVQLERGDKATEYAPYFEPIELCKLGDYQDRIFKDGDTWKIEKKVGKYILNNTVSTISSIGTSTNTTRFQFNNALTEPEDKNSRNLVKSSHLKPVSNWSADNVGIWMTDYEDISRNTTFWIRVPNTIATTEAQLRTWLTSNSVSIYYVLATPTTTEITYQPLIDQLNELETLATVKGYNHITTDTPSVQPFLEFGYFRPDPTVTKDEWLWVENHYEQLGGERRYTHNLSVNHNTAQGHWDYAFTIVGKEASHYTQLAQVAYYLFREHAGLHIPVSGTYTEGNDVYLLTKITASSLGQVTIEMRKLSDGSVRSISTGAVPVLDTIS